MLRVNQCRSSKAARNYFTRADYYLGDQQELPGRWGGMGAKRLGLSGLVDKRAFDALCDGRDPRTGKTLTARRRANRTPGYDFNFHPPKSLSVLYGLTGDPAILEAFHAAVDDTMRQMEARMKTRVRVRGQSRDRVAGNAIWSTYLHTTARPVNGTPDPHLHAHCFVFNLVYDPAEKRWKAGQFRDLKGNAPYYQSVFQTNLAGRLVELGYKLDTRSGHWEIAGLPPALLRKFSRRTDQVEGAAKHLGIHSDRVKDKLGAVTREAKASGVPMAVLREQWNRRLTDDEREAVRHAGIYHRRAGQSGSYDRLRVRHRRPLWAVPPDLAEPEHLVSLAHHRQRVAVHEQARVSAGRL